MAKSKTQKPSKKLQQPASPPPVISNDGTTADADLRSLFGLEQKVSLAFLRKHSDSDIRRWLATTNCSNIERAVADWKKIIS